MSVYITSKIRTKKFLSGISPASRLIDYVHRHFTTNPFFTGSHVSLLHIIRELHVHVHAHVTYSLYINPVYSLYIKTYSLYKTRAKTKNFFFLKTSLSSFLCIMRMHLHWVLYIGPLSRSLRTKHALPHFLCMGWNQNVPLFPQKQLPLERATWRNGGVDETFI